MSECGYSYVSDDKVVVSDVSNNSVDSVAVYGAGSNYDEGSSDSYKAVP